MNRRTLLKTGALGGVGMLTLGTSACGKNLSTYVSIIIGALEELSPLLPGQSSVIATAVKIAKDFDEAYRAGKFASATALFSNLAGVIGQIADSIGVSSPAVKTAIAIAGIALRAIAVLLKQQSAEPAVAAVIASQRSAIAIQQMDLINRLADPIAVDLIFKNARP